MREWCKRSFMNWVFVRETCQTLAAEGFSTVPVALKAQLAEVFSTLPTSVIEHGFHCMRGVETKQQSNKVVTSGRKWWAPIAKGVLTQRHSYQEVNWRLQKISSQDPQALPEAAFVPRTKKGSTSLDMRAIVSTRATADWPSPSPASYTALAADMAVMAHCHEQQCWELAKHAWLCTILVPGMLVRRHQQAAWWFIAGSLGSLCLRVWGVPPPARRDPVRMAMEWWLPCVLCWFGRCVFESSVLSGLNLLVLNALQLICSILVCDCVQGHFPRERARMQERSVQCKWVIGKCALFLGVCSEQTNKSTNMCNVRSANLHVFGSLCLFWWPKVLLAWQ